MFSKSNSVTSTRVLDYRVSTSIIGLPVLILLGRNRVPMNIVCTFNWQSQKVSTGGKGSGKGSGKGGGSQQYNYSMGAIGVLCLGPVTAIQKIWQNKTVLVTTQPDPVGYTVPGGGGNVTPTSGLSQKFAGDAGVYKQVSQTITVNNYGDPQGSHSVTVTQRVPGVKVSSSPSAGQYTVDSNGKYTFSAADSGVTWYINYTFVQGNPTAPGALPIENLQLTLLTGTTGQAIWSGIVGQPVPQIGYSEMAYVGNLEWEMGTSGQLPNYTYEIDGPLQYGGGIVDALTSDVINFLLTNRNCANIDSSFIGPLTQIANYCLANSLFISPVIDQQTTYSTVLKEFLMVANAEVISSEGLLKFGCYSEITAAGNNAVYAPATTPLFDLTPDDFIVKSPGDAPIQFSYDAPMDVINKMSIEWTDRDNDYNTSVVSQEDADSTSKYGPNTGSPLTAHSICSQAVAAQVLDVQLKRGVYQLRKVKFNLGWKYGPLEPMDVVTIPEQYPSTGRLAARFLRIEEDEEGSLACECELLLFGISAPTLHPKQSGSSFTPGYNAPPGSVNPPIFYELPQELTQTVGLQLAIGLSGGAPNWGGCSVYVSTDNGANYVLVGVNTNRSVMGTLSAILPIGLDPDTSNTASVDLRESLGVLSPVQKADADAYKSIVLFDQEIIAYEYATATGSSQYDLKSGSNIYLRRGVFGTTITAHAIGSPVLALDGSPFEYPYESSDVGRTLYFKFTSFNLAGQQEEDIANVTAYKYTLVFNRPPWPIHPLLAATTNDAQGNLDPIWGALTSFTIQQSYTLNGDGSKTAVFAITTAQNNNTPSASTVAPKITAISTSSSGGSLAPGTYVVAVTSIGTDGKETSLSLVQVVTIPSGSSTNRLTLTITFANVSDSPGYAYVAASPTIPSAGWNRASLVVNGSNYDVQTLSTVSPQAPDPEYDHAVLEARVEYHGGIWAGAVNVISTTTYAANTVTILQFTGSTWTVNQLVGRALTLLSRQNNTAVPYLDAAIVANTADTLTLSLRDTDANAAIGDVWMIRAYANIGTSTTIGDAAFINGGAGQAGTGLDIDAEKGRVAWIVAGPHAGNWRPIIGNDHTTLTVSPGWGFTPTSSDIFIVVDASTPWTQTLQSLDTQSSPTLSTNFPVDNSIGATYMVLLLAADSSGDVSPPEVCPFREMYQPGGGLTQVNVSTTPYAQLSTDQVITLLPGASVVNCLPWSAMTRRGLYILNASGADVTVNASAGYTIEGGASLVIHDGDRWQVLPNV